jgi:MtrB/PioB family decaheme-associated outer membrane protein
MRNRLTIGTAALVLAFSSLARAQQKPADTPAPAPSFGQIDFGYRGFSTEGDAARAERYRDLRDGAHTLITLGKKNERYLFDAGASNPGYHDQRYFANYTGGKLKFTGLWDSIPLNYSYITSSPFVEASPGVFTLDAAARLAVQNKTAVGVPCGPGAPPAACSNPTNAAQALANRSIFNSFTKTFDLVQRRDAASLGLAYAVGKDLGLNVAFSSSKKTGAQPWGASFAFNNANELPAPLDNRTNDVSAGLEWATAEGLVSVGWTGSWFNNNIKELVWDNPVRATDTTPFDPNGYSNGNGPARGRMAVAPSNSLNTVSATGLYKMPNRTTINGTVSFTAMNQNDAIIPWTINPVIANAGVYATFPGLAALPRATAEAKVHGLNGAFNFTSRPNNFFGLTMRYRFNDHRNLTPHFNAEEYVRFDAVPEEAGGETEQFNIRQNTFDLTGSFAVMRHSTLRVGYVYDDYSRTGRAFSDMRDYTVRTSLDTVGTQHLMVRITYDHTKRIGSGFSESSIEEGGAQPGLRFYDEADRDRDKGTVLVVVTPMDTVDVTASVATAKDKYHGEGHEFGLLDTSNQSYNIGVNLRPAANTGFGANFGYDTFSSLQSSRNANPPQDLTASPQVLASDYGSWFDPNRTWTLDNGDKVKNVNLYLDVKEVARHTDLAFNYDYSDSNQAFTHGGPRVTELTRNQALSGPSAIVYPTNPANGQPFTIPAPCAAGLTSCFVPLPNVTNKWQRFRIDLKHMFSPRVGLGLGYWYDKLDISDFATIDTNGSVGYTAPTGTPRIDYLGGLMLGYGNRPYKGQSVFVRVLGRF